jgi:hypothetical protein
MKLGYSIVRRPSGASGLYVVSQEVGNSNRRVYSRKPPSFFSEQYALASVFNNETESGRWCPIPPVSPACRVDTMNGFLNALAAVALMTFILHICIREAGGAPEVASMWAVATRTPGVTLGQRRVVLGVWGCFKSRKYAGRLKG